MNERRRVLFVCRASSGESLRSAQAIAMLDNVEVVTADVSDAEQVIDAAVKLRNEHGSIERIVTAQETLLEAVALANEALDLPGMSSEIVRGTLDKSRLKATLKEAGVNTPRYRLVSSALDAQRFVDEIGFPIVLKSVAGSGALATLLITNDDDLSRALAVAAEPLLAEQYIRGQELCIDTITIANEPQFHSICCYQPPILAAVEQPATQWRCVMPRDMESYSNFIENGLKAIRALRVGDAMTHMEGFIDQEGAAWFTDATLRPAGARIAPMLAFAYDIDPYRAWARVAVDDCFDGPWERKYAVGTIFLRGAGSGVVKRVDGIDALGKQIRDLIVDERWPRVGSAKSVSYTGDGFVTVRHSETDVVHDALDRIARAVRIVYSSNVLPAAEWHDRLHNYNELNRPAWDRPN